MELDIAQDDAEAQGSYIEYVLDLIDELVEREEEAADARRAFFERLRA